MFLLAVSCWLTILQLEFLFKCPKNVSVAVIFFILSRMESFFCFKTMMDKKSIVEDHKVITSNVSLTDLTDSIKTILEKQNKEIIEIKVITDIVCWSFPHLRRHNSNWSLYEVVIWGIQTKIKEVTQYLLVKCSTTVEPHTSNHPKYLAYRGWLLIIV